MHCDILAHLLVNCILDHFWTILPFSNESFAAPSPIQLLSSQEPYSIFGATVRHIHQGHQQLKFEVWMWWLARYKLPVVIIVLNNGGIYGGDRRPSALQQAAAFGAAHAGFASDPVPTAFVPDAR